jgi:hypothetical protein
MAAPLRRGLWEPKIARSSSTGLPQKAVAFLPTVWIPWALWQKTFPTLCKVWICYRKVVCDTVQEGYGNQTVG